MMTSRPALLAVLLSLILAACSLLGLSGAYFTHSVTLDGLNISTGHWVKPPHICSIAPCSGLYGCGVHALILGSGFQAGARVELLHGPRVIEADGELHICAGSIACHFSLWGACGGHWDVRVTNPDGGAATLKRGFLVLGWPCGACGDEGGGAAQGAHELEGEMGPQEMLSAPDGLPEGVSIREDAPGCAQDAAAVSGDGDVRGDGDGSPLSPEREPRAAREAEGSDSS